MITVLLNPVKLDQRLDPRDIHYTNEFQILENLVTRLISLDEKGQYQLDLASSLQEISKTEFIITLKPRSFSNGEAITANDVKSSLERSLSEGSSHVDFKNVLDRIVVENKSSIRIKLKKPSKSFFYYFSLPDMGVLHSSQYRKNKLVANDFTAVTSGPFLYGEEHGKFLLRKNTKFVHAQEYPDEIRLENLFDGNPVEKILSNRIALGKLSVDSFLKNRNELESKENIKVIGVSSSSFTYLFHNTHSSVIRSLEERLFIKSQILKEFAIPSEFSSFARKSIQYFPPESIAYVEENILWNLINDVKKPSKNIEPIEVHTYTTAFKVTYEPIVRKLESISGLKIKIIPDVNPSDYDKERLEGKFEYFLNIMATDFRAPVEAINFEFFSKFGPLNDNNNIVRNAFDKYQLAETNEQEISELRKISEFIFKGDQVIPLYHSATPFIYNSSQVDISGLNHLFLYNFWKLQVH